MSDYLLLSLRFRARHREPLLHEIAAVMEDIEAAYFAAHRYLLLQRNELPHREFASIFHTERRTLSAVAGGFLDDLLAEIEYTTRAIQRLERAGAEAWIVDGLRSGLSDLLEQQRMQVQRGTLPGRTLTPVPALQTRRVSMASPLDILAGIPPEYWKAGGLVLFLTALESRFNMFGRIRVERAQLRADEREAELREKNAARALAELESREDYELPLGDLAEDDPPFQLASGEVRVEDSDDAQRASERDTP